MWEFDKINEVEKEFWIVNIGEIDKQVDGGTHINHLKEIGKIEVIKTVNKGKNNRRMYFILKEYGRLIIL